MPRIIHVARAQQRFETKPVLDPSGNQIQTPVRDKDGKQKTTKFGHPIFQSQTVRDYTKPLPNHVCDSCDKEILPGTPYKHITPYNGTQRNRHEDCPDWRVWEYSNSVSARAAQAIHEFETQAEQMADSADAESARDDFAAAIRELADEKEESASNQEEHFGTSEIRDIADALAEWADEIESADIPEFPEPEEQDCEDCDGTGTEAQDETPMKKACETCDGTGRFTPDEPTDEQIEDWRNEFIDNVPTDSPV